jgi:hypothetical protein
VCWTTASTGCRFTPGRRLRRPGTSASGRCRSPAGASPCRLTSLSPGGADVHRPRRYRDSHDGDTGRVQRPSRRHLLVASFIVAYLAAGGMTLALGKQMPVEPRWCWTWSCVLPGGRPTRSWSGASTSPAWGRARERAGGAGQGAGAEPCGAGRARRRAAGDPASLRPARAWSARSCWCMPSP